MQVTGGGLQRAMLRGFAGMPWVDFPATDAAMAAVASEDGTVPGTPPGLGLLEVDGALLDPQTLCCVDEGGAVIAVSKLSLRDMRAELSARRLPLYGTKKDLAKRLQARTAVRP